MVKRDYASIVLYCNLLNNNKNSSIMRKMVVDKVRNTAIIRGVEHHWVDLLLVSPSMPSIYIFILFWGSF